jgi:hypothetical protein
MTVSSSKDLKEEDNAYILGRDLLVSVLVEELKDKSLTDIFNQVKTHLLTQKVKSTAQDSCVYRSPVGHKCAIGCLIPDDKYCPNIEGIGVVPVDDGNGFWKLLEDLQRVHDSYESWEWEERLNMIEQKYKLNDYQSTEVTT